MSDLKDEDLLTYELGDDIDDQALYGADEDELLLTDEELEKDVTNEEKQQIKAEAEKWVNEKIQEQQIVPENNGEQANIASENIATKETNATNQISTTQSDENSDKGADDVTTSAGKVDSDVSTFTQHSKEVDSPNQLTSNSNNATTKTAYNSINADDAISSSSKEVEVDHVSLVSCSTMGNVTDSSVLASSQESLPSLSASGVSGDYGDPREDLEDEREGRTNIKTTNEREMESANGNAQSPDKQKRYGPNKRIPGDNPNPLIRPHRYPLRPPYHNPTPRAMMNRGGFPPMPHGHFPPHPAPNTPPHNMYATPVSPQQPHGNVQLSPGGSLNTISPQHQHEAMQRMPLRHPYPSYRPMIGNFRHPMHGNPYGPHEFNGSASQHGPPQYGQNFMSQPPGMRGMFRPEMQQNMAPRLPPPPPGMRMHRAPLPSHNLIGAPPGFVGNQQQQVNAVRQPVPPQQPATQSALPNVTNVPRTSNLPIGVTGGALGSSANAPTLRPSKVLINPNFKGGVEAATSKFIQETQFMAAIGASTTSDEELLRQQEEFINKNRQHIEKRRNERAASPQPIRRNSRSRSRSRSRERSYTPPLKRNAGSGVNERHFERDRERVVPRPGNRFRRGNSRDRGNAGGSGGYENRNSGGNYNKRRRSGSPPTNRGNGASSRRGDRDRNEDEDDETRAYRLKIEKQKELREKIMRDKEMKRRRAAEEKQHEEKRGGPQAGNNNAATSNYNSNSKSNSSTNTKDEPEKLKPIIVTQPKIISLKKRQLPNESDGERKRSTSPTSGRQPRRQLPTAKIMPEAKRTLSEHLACAANSGGGGGSSSHSSNTAIIKPVQKSREHSHTLTPPRAGAKATMSASLASKHTRRLSTPSDDEVQLDYDEDELMLDEEDRLLATPTPSPTHTPSPEPVSMQQTAKLKQQQQQKVSTASYSSSNRRVVLKSTNKSERHSNSESIGRGRKANSRQRESASGGSSSQSSRNSNNNKGIFDRLDIRSGGSASGSDSKRKTQRIVLKHN